MISNWEDFKLGGSRLELLGWIVQSYNYASDLSGQRRVIDSKHMHCQRRGRFAWCPCNCSYKTIMVMDVIASLGVRVVAGRRLA